MKTSRDRILTTHIGSLPRGEALSDLLVAKANGEPFDATELDTRIEAVLALPKAPEINAFSLFRSPIRVVVAEI